jgi:hypothetical protein
MYRIIETYIPSCSQKCKLLLSKKINGTSRDPFRLIQIIVFHNNTYHSSLEYLDLKKDFKTNYWTCQN